MLDFLCATFISAMTVKYLILFTFYHLELVWLVYNCFLFIMFLYKGLILINEWTNLKFCTSFAIRQQWLPPGVANCMVFNFNNGKNVHGKGLFAAHDVTQHWYNLKVYFHWNNTMFCTLTQNWTLTYTK